MSYVGKASSHIKRTIERSTNECHPLVFINSKASHLHFWNKSSHDIGESGNNISIILLNQSCDSKWGGGIKHSCWIWWWSLSWINWGGYDGPLGVQNLPSICYKYRLSNQYSDQISDKNIRFYSQRYPRRSILQTQLEEHPRHTLNKSQTERTTELTIEAHISSFGPCTRTSAWSGDQTPTPRLRTSRIHSLHYQHSSSRLHLPAIPGIPPTAENRYMNHEDRFPLSHPSRLIPVAHIPYHSTPLVHTILTYINR